MSIPKATPSPNARHFIQKPDGRSMKFVEMLTVQNVSGIEGMCMTNPDRPQPGVSADYWEVMPAVNARLERARAERMEAERAEQCEAIKKYGTKYLDWSELGPKADEMIAEGYALHEIAEILSISRSRLYNYVRRKKGREGVA